MTAAGLIPFIPFVLGAALLAVAWWRHRVRENGGGLKAPRAAARSRPRTPARRR